ncbi:MAG: hypothetical protein FJ405_11715 [Verrucomicrobia bacterium]|nr:hypothetical protein [Verrucomicrobiota bacterium]
MVHLIRTGSGRAPLRYRGSASSLALLLFFTAVFPMLAAPPALEQFHPVSAGIGTSNLLSASGALGSWPPKVWTSTDSVQLIPQSNSPNFVLLVASNAQPGPILIRLYNAEGSSLPRMLMLTQTQDEREKEPNDDWRELGDAITNSITISGRLDKAGDVDSFRVRVRAGQTLVSRLEAYVFGSPVDAVIRILDSRGVQLGLNHDDGMTLDPLLAVTAHQTEDWTLQVFGFSYPAGSDVRFHGSASCVYRMHISTDPWARHVVPLGIPLEGDGRRQVLGWNLSTDPSASMAPVRVEEVRDRPWARAWFPGVPHPVLVSVGLEREILEQEAGQELEVPLAVTGQLRRSGERDCYRFKAKKGQVIVASVSASVFGFSVDPVLEILDSSGKQLARADDGAGRDPELSWTSPEEGVYTACVSQLLRHAAPDDWYRLALELPAQGFRPRTSGHQFVFGAGTTNEITVALGRRHGFADPMEVSLKTSPAGVECAPVEVPATASEAKLKVRVDKGAAAFSGPVRVMVRNRRTQAEQPAPFELVTSGVDNGVPNGFQILAVEQVDDLWLTVTPSPPEKP